MRFRVDLFFDNVLFLILGVALGEDWKPRLPDIQIAQRKSKNIGACQDGHLTVD